MKYFNSFAILVLLIGIFSLLPAISDAYTITHGAGAKLNASSFNVRNCQAKNNYYVSNWGGNNTWATAPFTDGYRTYLSPVPGSYIFSFRCQDDDKPQYFDQDASLTVLPKIPTVMTDSCNTSKTEATLDWNDISYSTSYLVYITRPSTGCPTGWTPINTGADLECVEITTASTVSFPTISGFSYNWRVLARVGMIRGGSSGSGNIVCTVPAPPEVPKLPPPPNIDPVCNLAGNSVDISWTSVVGASSYRAHLDYASTPAINPDRSRNNNLTNEVTFSVIPGVENTLTVSTINSEGVEGDTASKTFTCTAPAVPLPPTTVTPQCNTEGTAVTLRWPAMANATSYHVRLNNLSTADPNDKWNNNFAGTEIIYPVTPGVSYEAWVHSVNLVNEISVATYTPAPFACKPPVLPPPPSVSYTCIGVDSAILTWPAVTGASSYRILLDYASTPTVDPDMWNIGHVARSITQPVIPGVANKVTIDTSNAIGEYGDDVVLNFTCDVPATACTAGTQKTWNVGGNTCSGPTPLTSSGAIGSVIDSTSPETGTAQYSCTNGTWSTDPVVAPTCNAPVVGSPDLVVQTHNLGTFSNLTKDIPITLAGRMRNNGTVSTPIAVFTKFTYKWGVAGIWTDIREFNKGIVNPAGVGIIPQDLVNFTPNQTGQLFLQYCVDSRNQIDEGGYEDNCRQVGPITVSLPPVSGPGTPSGDISVEPCTILVGETVCDTRVTWNSNNFVGTPQIKQGSVLFSTDPNKLVTEAVTRTVSQADNTFTLTDTGSGLIDSASALASCADGSVWVPGLGICAEKPTINAVADPNVIRSGNKANLNIVIDSAYDLSCTIKDGGRDVVFPHNGNTSPVTVNPPMTTRPLTSAQIVNIYCASQAYPELFGEAETRVNVERTIQEI